MLLEARALVLLLQGSLLLTPRLTQHAREKVVSAAVPSMLISKCNGTNLNKLDGRERSDACPQNNSYKNVHRHFIHNLWKLEIAPVTINRIIHNSSVIIVYWDMT